MHIIYFILLCALFQPLLANNNRIHNHNIRNLSYKVIIFKEKKYPKLLDYIKSEYRKVYNKTICAVNDQINNYESLSPEDKRLLEFMFSLIL